MVRNVTSGVRTGDPQGPTRPLEGFYRSLYKHPTGGIGKDLASFAIFFDPREAHFCSFWGRMSPKLHVGFLVRHVPVCRSYAPNMVVCAK